MVKKLSSIFTDIYIVAELKQYKELEKIKDMDEYKKIILKSIT